MDDPNPPEGGLRFFLRTFVRALVSSVGRIAAVALITCTLLASIGGVVALCYFGWSAVPLGLGLGAAAGVVVTAGVFAIWND